MVLAYKIDYTVFNGHNSVCKSTDLEQVSANYGLWAKSGQPPVLVN